MVPTAGLKKMDTLWSSVAEVLTLSETRILQEKRATFTEVPKFSGLASPSHYGEFVSSW